MGGYIEDGFPSILSTARCCSYLGCETEAEFIDDIDGRRSPTLLSDDRAVVDREVADQLEASGEYVVGIPDEEKRTAPTSGCTMWAEV